MISVRANGILSMIPIVVMTGTMALAKPLKVYILAGQSNMEGHAHVDTIPAIGMDPKTAPLLDMIQDETGKARVADHVWISYLTAKKGEKVVEEGKLTTGFGAVMRGPKIGPELTFGMTLERHMDNPILLIKTAWGGQSLYKDFRPPSAGPIELNNWQKETYSAAGRDLDETLAKQRENTGVRYQQMISHVKDVLANVNRIIPDYNPKDGYEIAGFVWFQGWNDKVNSHAYPDRDKPGGYDVYSELLAQFICDVRKDLKAPDMPFVIGVHGQKGPIDPENPSDRNAMKNYFFRLAQAAPAALPEFKGNVAAVLVEKYWDQKLGEIGFKLEKVKSYKKTLSRDKSLTKEQAAAKAEVYQRELITDEELAMYRLAASNAGFHYYGSAKMFAQFGKAFAEAILAMEK